MGPLMYRQRPAFPALIFSVCVLIAGAFITFWLKRRVEVGLAEESSVMFAVFTAIGLASCGLIAGFARYQFTHLWKKKPAPEPEDEEVLQQRSRGRW